MRTRNSVSLIEAAYAVDATDRAWLEGIAASARLRGDGGAYAYTYNASRVPMSVSDFVNAGTRLTREIAEAAIRAASEAYVSRMWRAKAAATTSEDPKFREYAAVHEHFYSNGIRDILFINAFDPTGIGVLVGTPMSEEVTLAAPERNTWSQIAMHICAAMRLRRRAARSPSAVLSPGGRVEHAEGDAQAARSREALREAVLRMERARGSMRRREPDAAVALWTTLVDARWTLLDAFECDGKRYLVATENPPIAPGPEILSVRERQILAAAALGRTNKLIAYELGLSDATVRVLLSRAARKLAVRTRKELVALYQAHAAGAPLGPERRTAHETSN